MKVLLIWPYNEKFASIRDSFPLGIGYLLSNIDKSVYDVTFLDCALEKIKPTSWRFRRLIRRLKPSVAGISWWSQNSKIVQKMLEVIKITAPETTTVVGGPHPSVCGAALLKYPNCDFAFRGEAEIGFSMLLECIREKDFGQLDRIPGLVCKDSNGKIIENKQQFIDDLDTLGGIDYETLNLKRYHKSGYNYGGKAISSRHSLTAPIVATRGCPYLCQFCSARMINGRKIRTHSSDYIVNTVKKLYEDYNVRLISLMDDNFTFSLDFASEVCEKIASLGYSDLKMATPNGIRFEKMTEGFAVKMFAAGWREVVIAPESGSPRTLRKMKKAIDLDRVPPVVEICHRAGLKVYAFFIIGYPDETIEDLSMTESFIQRNNFDNMALHLFQPLPGTPIFNELVEKGEIQHSFVPGAYDEVTYSPRSLSKDDLRDAANRIWNNFRKSRGWKYEDFSVYYVRINTSEKEEVWL